MTALPESLQKINSLEAELSTIHELDDDMAIQLVQKCLALAPDVRERLLRRYVPWLRLKDLANKDSRIGTYMKACEDWEYESSRSIHTVRSELQRIDVFSMPDEQAK